MSPRSRGIVAVVAVGTAIASVFTRLDARNAVPLSRGVCTAASAHIAQEWGATGEWRTLAPYPVARDVSPTDSVGVWLERTSLVDGVEELRRVSAERTTVARISVTDCRTTFTVHRRTFDSAATAHSFTDARLRALLQTHARGLIYVWSPRMPLSVRGLGEARAAAASLGIAFTAIVADADMAGSRGVTETTVARGGAETRRTAGVDAGGFDDRDAQTLDALELVYRNGAQHYPSAVFYRDGKIVDVAIPGYQSRVTYQALAATYLADNRAALLATRVQRPSLAATFWVDHKARVTTLSTVPTVRRLGFFFKPIANTSLISYTANEASYLFDMRTGKEQRIPGNVDPVPTPDGRLLLRPGLLLYPMATLTKGDTIPVYEDPELPDEYQTASIQQERNGVVRYRVITGWRQGARFRDYDVTFTAKGAYKNAVPVGTPFVPCGARNLTLPINAKSGQEFGAYDAGTRTNVILEVTPMKSCLDKLDLGFASGKLSFSYDGSVIAFATSRVDTDADGLRLRPAELVYKDALLLYRRTGRIVALSNNRGINALSFPEFLKNGNVMVLDQAGPGRTREVLRTVEVR